MMRFKRVGILVVVFFTALACAIPVPTSEPLTRIDPVQDSRTIGRDGASWAEVRLRLLSKRLEVYPFDGAELLQGWFYYNVQEWAPNVNQQTEGVSTRVTINQGLGSQIPLGKGDEYLNEWKVGVVRGMPIDLGIDMGGGTAALDLSGVSLSSLSLTNGTADVSLTFSVPNPEPLSLLRVTTGTGGFVTSGLGNANFDRFSLIGGTGTVDLDFNGAWRRSALADIRAGAGKFTVRVPAGLGVRVKFASIPLSSVDVIGFRERYQDDYVNDAYGQAPLTLTINLTTGVGSVTLISQ